jgi:hypothetical protein
MHPNQIRRRALTAPRGGAGAVVLVASLVCQDALACGTSTGGGSVTVCSVDAMREESRRKWHVGGGLSSSSTTLVFQGKGLDEKLELDQWRSAFFSTLEWRATPRWNLRSGLGMSWFGGLGDSDATVYEGINPGVVATLGASYVAIQGSRKSPFLLLDAQLSANYASTSSTSVALRDTSPTPYSAYDLRFGVVFGMTFFRFLTPYALARVFGGPVLWSIDDEPVVGSDKYHYQLGLGVSVTVFSRLDFFLEGVGLGERGGTAGLGISF